MGLLDRLGGIIAKLAPPPVAPRADPELSKGASGIASQLKNGMVAPHIKPQEFVELVDRDPYISAGIDRIRNEVSKRGHNWIPAWEHRCAGCKTDFDELPEACSECGSVAFLEPDPKQKERVEKVFDKPNHRMTGKDLIKSYAFYNRVVDAVHWQVIMAADGMPAEIWPLRSEYMRPYTDKATGMTLHSGQWFCQSCRLPDLSDHAGPCQKCRGPLSELSWALVDDINKIIIPYSAEEIIFDSTRALGGSYVTRSPLLSLWAVAQVERWWTLHLWNSLSSGQSVDRMVAYPKLSAIQVDMIRDKIEEQRAKSPIGSSVFHLAVEENPVVLDMMEDLKAMNLMEGLKYLRETKLAVLGLSGPVLGITTPGRLGSETDTIEVSFDTVEEVQSQFEEFIRFAFLPLFHNPDGTPYLTDWKLSLTRASLQDESDKLDVQKKRWDIIKEMLDHGAELDIKSDLTFTMTSPPKPGANPPGLSSDLPSGGATLGPKDGAPFQKGLSPRNTPREDAVKGASRIEDGFSDALKAEHQAASKKLIGLADNPEQFRSQAPDILADFARKATSRSRSFAEELYRAAVDEEEGSFSQPDEDALALLEDLPSGFPNTFVGFSADESEKVYLVLKESYAEGIGLKAIRERMKEYLDAQDYQLDRIARSETTRITNTGRAMQWRKRGLERGKQFKWIIAQDSRTDDICRQIAANNPYTLEELREETNDFLPHPQCRCSAVRDPTLEV